ncbi:MAG: YdeI/OmpD-associated family protein [Altibacter sp.]|nr:YdeI/OmpD-associated family protein [Altibacter sp.]
MGLLRSKRFEVAVKETHTLEIPQAIALPFIEKGHSRVQFCAYFKDTEIQFHGALKQIKGRFLVSFGKRYQKELGVSSEDCFMVEMVEDTSKYGVEMPEEFSAVLESDPEAEAMFEAFSDGKKRSLIYYILRFKNSQTRIDKALHISENIKRGITDPKDLIKSPH